MTSPAAACQLVLLTPLLPTQGINADAPASQRATVELTFFSFLTRFVHDRCALWTATPVNNTVLALFN